MRGRGGKSIPLLTLLKHRLSRKKTEGEKKKRMLQTSFLPRAEKGEKGIIKLKGRRPLYVILQKREKQKFLRRYYAEGKKGGGGRRRAHLTEKSGKVQVIRGGGEGYVERKGKGRRGRNQLLLSSGKYRTASDKEEKRERGV